MYGFNAGRAMLLGALLAAAATGAQAADYRIIDQDAGSGSGFDAERTVPPVGGNTGATLGDQRRIALVQAVRIVLSRVSSTVPVRIRTQFIDDGSRGLSCQADRATLAIGGPISYAENFPDAPQSDVVYPLALAESLVGRRFANQDADGGPLDDVGLIFNGQLDEGRDSCLQGLRWYYGLDGDAPDGTLDFVGTAVHEMIHGLGFQSLVALRSYTDTDGRTTRIGQFPALQNGRRDPDVYSTFIQDLSMPGQPRWPALSADERADSLDNGPDVVWSASNTSAAAGGYLSAGLNQGRVKLYAPADIEGESSISHWDTSLVPDQIMEPFESPDVSVRHGLGLASCVLEDMGWRLAGGIRCPDVGSDTFAGSSSGRIVDTDGHPVRLVTNDNDSDNGSDNDDSDNHDGGGGGCTLVPGSPFDPLWALMLALAGGVLVWRRRGRVMD